MAKQTSPVRTAGRKSAGKQNAKSKPRSKIDSPRQIKIQKALYEIVDAASGVTDMRAFYKRLHEIVGTLMYAENFVIMLIDAIAKTRSYPYYSDSAGDVAPPSSPIPEHSLLAELIRNPHTLHWNRRQNEDAIRRGEMFGTPSESFVGVPFKMGDQVIGGIIVQSYIKEIAYSEEDVSVLEFVAQHIAIALTRARAIDETRQRNAELQIINSVQQGLASKLKMQEIYDLIGDKIRDVFDAQGVSIDTYDPVTNLLHFRYSIQEGERIAYDPLPLPDKGFRAYIIRTRQPLRLDDVEVEGAVYGLAKLTPTNAPAKAKPDMPKSWLGVPLLIGGEARGVVNLYNVDRTGAYNDSDVRLLETLANSMSVALENARLFDEVQRKNIEITEALDQQTATSGILRVIARSLTDVQPVFDAIIERAVILCGGAAGFAYRIIDDQVHLVSQYNVVQQAFEEVLTQYPTPLDKLENGSGIGFVIRSRSILHVADMKSDPRLSQWNHDIAAKYGAGATLWIPLVKDDIGIGAIFIAKYVVEPFTNQQIALVKTFADQAVIAIENVRLFTETQRLLKETEDRAAELAVINRVQEGLANKLDYHAIVDLVGDTIRDIFHAQSLSIGRYDHANQMVDYSYVVQNGQRTYYDPMPFSGVTHHLIHTRQMLMVNENVKQKMEEIGSHWGDLEIPRTLIYVPLIAGEMVTGVVALYNYERENAFGESDIRLLQTLCNAMSVALENARLWEQEKMYRKALQRELEIGREIQSGFLPENLPQVEGWEIAASLMSAREVAGDFYDAFELPDGMIGLVIADVCDKGVGAALFMTLFRSLIRAVSNLEYFEHTESVNMSHSTAERLKRAVQLTNNYIAETHGESGMFATLFFGILDPRDGRLTYVNGGHEPPLVLHVDGQKETLQKTGPAVGAIADGHFDLSETTLGAGDIFLAFTDGVPDCKDPHGDFYGRERLLNIFRETKESAQGLVNVIESDLRQYIANATQFDDITLMAMRKQQEG